jgi:hypothetical protein
MALSPTLVSSASAMEDDSPFLSMADFFSLISLTLIYAMLILAPQAPVPEDAITVLSGRISADGQQSSVDAKFAFVSLEAEGDAYHLVYRWPKQRLYSDIRVSGSIADVHIASVWLDSELVTGPTPERVVFYLREDETRPEAHRLFNLLQQSTKRGHAVSAVYLHPDEHQ